MANIVYRQSIMRMLHILYDFAVCSVKTVHVQFTERLKNIQWTVTFTNAQRIVKYFCECIIILTLYEDLFYFDVIFI